MAGRKTTTKHDEVMTTEQLELKIESIIDIKLNALFQDYFGSYEGEPKESFLKMLEERITNKDRKFIDHADVLKEYGLD